MILCLLAFSVFSLVASFLVSTLEEKILLIVCGSGVAVGILVLFPLYLEVQDDRIVTRLGVTSLNKKYRGSFKKHVFLFDDLRDLYMEEDKKTVHLTFKGGESATFSIAAFVKKEEIIELLYEARAQIRWFDQD